MTDKGLKILQGANIIECSRALVNKIFSIETLQADLFLRFICNTLEV